MACAAPRGTATRTSQTNSTNRRILLLPLKATEPSLAKMSALCRNIAAILVMEYQGLLGDSVASPASVSFTWIRRSA